MNNDKLPPHDPSIGVIRRRYTNPYANAFHGIGLWWGYGLGAVVALFGVAALGGSGGRILGVHVWFGSIALSLIALGFLSRRVATLIGRLPYQRPVAEADESLGQLVDRPINRVVPPAALAAWSPRTEYRGHEDARGPWLPRRRDPDQVDV